MPTIVAAEYIKTLESEIRSQDRALANYEYAVLCWKKSVEMERKRGDDAVKLAQRVKDRALKNYGMAACGVVAALVIGFVVGRFA